MPTHCKPDRMARVALTALTRTPKLAECDEASFFQCLLSLSQWGLEPDGRRAHLIPFENRRRGVVECQLIIDYKGYVELAYRSGVVKNIHADVVRDGDIFDYNMGRVERHVPWFLRRDTARPKQSGDVFAVYCMAELVGGTVKTEVLSRDDVEGIRRRSKSGGNGPWVTDWNEMAKKTAFRRLSKWLPLSADILDAMDADADRIETAPPAEPGPKLNTLDDLTTILTNGQSLDPPQIIDAANGEIPLDAEQADEPEQTEGPDNLAGAQALFDVAASLGDVAKAEERLLGAQLSDQERQAVETMASAARDRIRSKRSQHHKPDSKLFESAPNAQEA